MPSDHVRPPGRDDLFDDPVATTDTRLWDRDELVAEAMTWTGKSKPAVEAWLDADGHDTVERAVIETAPVY